MAELVRTKPNRPWLLKMLLFFVVCTGVGLWFLYDAAVAWPTRGWADASYRQWVYLDAAEQSGRLTARDLAIDDPKGEYADLKSRVTGHQLVGELPALRYEWLRALSVLGALDAETIEEQMTPQGASAPDPRARLDELNAEWAGPNARSQPKPLNAWDIPIQWAIAIICFAVSLYLVVHVVRILRVRYGWEAGERRLHLPDGSTLVPSDLEDVDKRKWHKFIVFLKVKEGHERHGGKELGLDLYQHAGLEGWVLEMERTAFPDRAEEEPVAIESGSEESQ